MSKQDTPTADELRRRREELGLDELQAANAVRCGFRLWEIQACEKTSRPNSAPWGAHPGFGAEGPATYGGLRRLYAERLAQLEAQAAQDVREEMEQQVAVRGEAREVLAELRRYRAYPATLRVKRFVQEHLCDLRWAYLRGEVTVSDIEAAIAALAG